MTRQVSDEVAVDKVLVLANTAHPPNNLCIRVQLMTYAQHHANHGAGHHQTTAAVTDKGQCQAFGGQEAGINTQINKRLATDKAFQVR